MTTPEQHARYNASPKGKARVERYRRTAKSLLKEMRNEARRRGTR